MDLSEAIGEGWTIVEENSFRLAVAIRSGDFQFFDDVLARWEYTLHLNPRGFERVPGVENAFVVNTELESHREGIIPSFRIWFWLDLSKQTVFKLWLDIAPSEYIEDLE